MKKAIVCASFGTSHLDALEKNISSVENELRAAFGLPIYRAFTSGVIVRALGRRGMEIDGVAAAVARARAEGAERIVVQPTHLIYGEEYEKLVRQAVECGLERSCVGKPLMADTEDLHWIARILIDENPLEPDEGLVLAGHGSAHPANAVYAAMEYHFRAQGAARIYVGTVEGVPGIEEVRQAVRRDGISKVRLRPLLLVAGDHARSDMAGDGADSWKNLLLSDGLEVRCVLRGLGQSAKIREIIVRHCEELLEAQE